MSVYLIGKVSSSYLHIVYHLHIKNLDTKDTVPSHPLMVIGSNGQMRPDSWNDNRSLQVIASWFLNIAFSLPVMPKVV